MVAAANTGANSHYDIVIVGGGMVGISLALLLRAQQPWNILLIEAQELASSDGPVSGAYSSSFDARSTALSWSSKNIYQSIGLWPQLKKHLSAIAQIHVSDRGHVGMTRIDAGDANVDALGYVVENQWLGSVLLNQLTKTDIQLLGSCKLETIEPLASGMRLQLQQADKDLQTIETKLLVIADGAGSTTAQQLGIQSQSTPYDQTGIIANVSLEKPHGGVAYERFTDQSPMALLPLADFKGRPRSALVWTQPRAMAETLMAADEQAFLEHLQLRFGYRLGHFKQLGKRVAYPLALTTATEQVRRHLVVMGNAAHSLHPVAGQGFNLSLRDAAALANSLAEAGDRIGDLAVLQNYQQQQAIDQRNTVLFSDSLPKLFGLSSSIVALGRNSGLLAMDLIPSLRNSFAQFGMGMATREPGNG
ncbi:2-octaprenyl-6-methoxyphenyl hydroxylase [Porticoccaceae bacterium]|jgi:2-octaprenyl-6-methoxyphenol hydroxylase|nr:2-octaprenyl-6-methoxyphenyl hydroxylase [Porticoccaceae bacterium]MDA8735187.1 2-octaprenyl-6-methoxyphenyl hydroxylase [Porticoccaceae bacterium]MDC0953491.1 2-octaprenyl-6-methoxyphenyl hydroxylase [Porticoccaceae bacterium]